MTLILLAHLEFTAFYGLNQKNKLDVLKLQMNRVFIGDKP